MSACIKKLLKAKLTHCQNILKIFKAFFDRVKKLEKTFLTREISRKIFSLTRPRPKIELLIWIWLTWFFLLVIAEALFVRPCKVTIEYFFSHERKRNLFCSFSFLGWHFSIESWVYHKDIFAQAVLILKAKAAQHW